MRAIRSDAKNLARHARLDPNILRPIAYRTIAQQEALRLIRAPALQVRLRATELNAVRGRTKSCGYRMPAFATTCFAQRSLAVMPLGLAQALGTVLQQIAWRFRGGPAVPKGLRRGSIQSVRA